jgi:LPS-assembly lipoprotein
MSRAVFLISSSNKFWLLLLPLLLAACSFHPLYGNARPQTGTALLSGIKVDPVSSRSGQLFTMELEDQLNPGGAVPSDARYRLTATLVAREIGLGAARDGTVSRYNVYLDTNYQLFRIADKKLMTSGHLTEVSSYNNITNQYYSTYVAQEDAYKRGVTELAQLVCQRLGSYLTENGGDPTPQVAPPKEQQPLVLPENPAFQNTIAPPIQPYSVKP